MAARVRVRLTAEILLQDNWGSDATLAQIEADAKRQALDAVRSGLALDGVVVNSPKKTPATLVGEPAVTMVLVTSEKG